MRKYAPFFPVLLLLAAVLPLDVSGAILPVPEKFQQYDQWCWNGTSQAILFYYGYYPSQTTIAQYGTHGYNVDNYLYGYDNTAPYYRRGVDYILNHFGSISSTGRAYALTQGTVTSEINAGRPFGIRWGWGGGGGHILVGRGIVGSNVYIMDPWPGNGYETRTYSWVVSGGVYPDNHTWTHSLQLTTNPPSSSSRAPLQLFAGDFDNDDYSDIAIFRPTTGLWSVRGVTRVYYGGSGDIPIPADFNGDGRSDIAIFRPTNGLWSVRGVTRFYYGRSGDYPIPASYHTGYLTSGIFRPSNGLWAWRGGGSTYFGRDGDIPVPGQYANRSGRWGPTYHAVFRPSMGLWAIQGITRFYFGGSSDTPVPGAYTTGSSDPWRAAIFRPSNGLWAIRGVGNYYYGSSGDIPVPADYAGSWGDEIAIFRPSNGLWAIRGVGNYYYGGSADTPVTR